MKALIKTLFGDALTLGLVGVVVVIAWAGTHAGYEQQVAFALPPMILGAVAWLARG